MGAQTLPAPVVTLPTRRTVVFTSSTTWTVPSSAMFVDVMVVGGGQGGRGGWRATNGGSSGGTGGAITIAQNLYLGGTGTVAITVGAGTNGTAGVATTSPTNASAAGQSLFGTFIASQGGTSHSTPSAPGYRGSAEYPYNGSDNTLANFTPILMQGVGQGSVYTGIPQNTGSGPAWQPNSAPTFAYSTDAQFWGLQGGISQSAGSAGGIPGGFAATSDNRLGTTSLNRLPWGAHLLLTFGAATAGTAAQTGGSPGAGGAAGLSGYSGGGGPAGSAASGNGGPGGPGAGGGGGNSSSGNIGGIGGNAGTNTGAGGGCGGTSGSSSTGTGGNGGNGAAGFVIVSYIGTN